MQLYFIVLLTYWLCLLELIKKKFIVIVIVIATGIVKNSRILGSISVIFCLEWITLRFEFIRIQFWYKYDFISTNDSVQQQILTGLAISNKTNLLQCSAACCCDGG